MTLTSKVDFEKSRTMDPCWPDLSSHLVVQKMNNDGDMKRFCSFFLLEVARDDGEESHTRKCELY